MSPLDEARHKAQLGLESPLRKKGVFTVFLVTLLIDQLMTYVIDSSIIAAMARSYNILSKEGSLENLISHFYKGKDLDQLMKRDYHWLINEFLLKNYRGEATVKAKLVKRFFKSDVTAAFEMRVHRSRLDFLTINGESRSYEIKSELDNLAKLSKQVNDYEKVFDYNFIVIDEIHYKKALQLIPQHYGILILHGQELLEERSAQLNDRLDTVSQLTLFTKKEFAQIFRIEAITLNEVLVNFTTAEINYWFKVMLKRRYAKRWDFLVSNMDNIFPIDYEFFFQHNIRPDIIYS